MKAAEHAGHCAQRLSPLTSQTNQRLQPPVGFVESVVPDVDVPVLSVPVVPMLLSVPVVPVPVVPVPRAAPTEDLSEIYAKKNATQAENPRGNAGASA